MREVTQDITIVETGHCNFGNNHLEESREGRKNAKFIDVKPKTGSGGEVATLHDTRRNENLRMLLVNDLQPCGAFQVTWITYYIRMTIQYI